MKAMMLSVEPISSVATCAKQALSGKPQGDYISFASLELLWKVLAPNRMAIVKVLAARQIGRAHV